jgi:hypothetical protein
MSTESWYSYHTQMCGDEWWSADGDEAEKIQMWEDDTCLAVVVYTPVPDEPNTRGTYTITEHDMRPGRYTSEDLTGWHNWQAALEFATGTDRKDWDKDYGSNESH